MKNALILILGIIIILGAAFYLHTQNFFTNKSDTFPKLGVVLPVSGDVDYGTETSRAIKLALEEFNIPKRKIKILDGNCDKETAKKAAQKLIKSGYKFIIGESCSGGTLGIAEIQEVVNGDAVVISSSASSELLANHPNVFRTNSSDKLNIEVLADAIEEKGETTVSILSDSREYAQSFAASLSKVLEAKNIDSENFIFDSSQGSIDSAVRKATDKIKVIKNSGFVVIPQTSVDAVNVFESIRKISDLQIYDAFVSASSPEVVVDAIGNDAEGIISVGSQDIEKLSRRFREFKTKYTSRYGSPMYDSYLLATYDAVTFLYFITKVTGKNNPKKFSQYLRENTFKSGIDFALENGNPIHRDLEGYDFDKFGDSVSEYSIPVIKVIRGGKSVRL